MTLTILNVIYVCVAIAMVVLILMQRGAGAQAGSGFGAGASATVFGARGASNFLSKSTKWLAVAFFVLSLGIGMFVTHRSGSAPSAEDLGVMGEAPAAAAPVDAEVPAAPASQGDVPPAPAAAEPAPAGDPAPASAPEAAKKDGNG
ncbi:MAG: preprotein translocase subunit SecG [Xanthomonadaceae bacterium]|jgi:preprotein translocase subunit SecG|nr:preprotein translocase subunit SecG [Xanthomonadaceae bacterium]